MARRLGSRVLVATLALALFTESGVWAGEAGEAIHEVFVAVNRLIETPELQQNPEELLASIRRTVNGRFDFREAARLALGSEWSTLTPRARDEFVRHFTELLELGFISRMASRARVQGGLTVSDAGESVDGDRAVVATRLLSRDGGEILLEFSLIRHGERWAAYDVRIDGVSLVANYRSQFARVIERTSYQELVAQLRAKTGYTPPAPSLTPRAASAPPTLRMGPPRARVDAPILVRADDRPAAASPPATLARAAASRQEPPAPSGSPVTPVAAISYWIQVGAFRSIDAAGGVAAHLLEQNLPIAIEAVAGDQRDTTLSRVRVGPFADRVEAAARLRALQQDGYRPFIALERE